MGRFKGIFTARACTLWTIKSFFVTLFLPCKNAALYLLPPHSYTHVKLPLLQIVAVLFRSPVFIVFIDLKGSDSPISIRSLVVVFVTRGHRQTSFFTRMRILTPKSMSTLLNLSKTISDFHFTSLSMFHILQGEYHE